ncbi:hypothetical protein L345_08966, partial [Ophiophagus hannah]
MACSHPFAEFAYQSTCHKHNLLFGNQALEFSITGMPG